MLDAFCEELIIQNLKTKFISEFESRRTVPRKRSYDTRQKRLVFECLALHKERYLSVDEVHDLLRGQDASVGRTTVYRTLEMLLADGEAVKVLAPGGGESRYRLIDPAERHAGQLLCLDCGTAFPLDCSMLRDFSSHVQSSHGFAIDQSRTVLYGHCASCTEAVPDSSSARLQTGSSAPRSLT